MTLFFISGILKGRVIYYQLGEGGGYIQGGGVGNFFGDVLGGVENKKTYGQGGGHVFCQVLGGSDVFHWSFFSLKFIASGGRPLHPSSIM